MGARLLADEAARGTVRESLAEFDARQAAADTGEQQHDYDDFIGVGFGRVCHRRPALAA